MLDSDALDLVEALQLLAVEVLPYTQAPPLAELHDAAAELASVLLAREDDLPAVGADVEASCERLLAAGDRVLLDSLVRSRSIDAATRTVRALLELTLHARALVTPAVPAS